MLVLKHDQFKVPIASYQSQGSHRMHQIIINITVGQTSSLRGTKKIKLTSTLNNLQLTPTLNNLHLTPTLNNLHLTSTLNNLHLTSTLDNLHLTSTSNNLHLIIEREVADI